MNVWNFFFSSFWYSFCLSRLNNFFFCSLSYWCVRILATLYFGTVRMATREQRGEKFVSDCLSAWKFIEKEKSFTQCCTVLYIIHTPYHKLRRIIISLLHTKLTYFALIPQRSTNTTTTIAHHHHHRSIFSCADIFQLLIRIHIWLEGTVGVEEQNTIQ